MISVESNWTFAWGKHSDTRMTGARRLKVLYLAGVILQMSVVAGAAQGSSPGKDGSNRILTLEAVIKLPDYPWHFAWSPDGKTIAVTQFNKGELRLVDVEKRTISEPVVRQIAGSTQIIWGPRGHYVVAAGRGNLRLFSQPTWSEAARLTSPHEGCRFQTGQSAILTKDERYLWVSCLQNNVSDTYLAAIKLDVPNLNIVDRLELDVPVRGRRTNAWKDTLQLQGNAITLSTIVTSYTPNKPEDPETPHDTLKVIELTEGTKIIASIDLARFGLSGLPRQALVAIEARLAAIRTWSQAQQLTITNLITGERIAAFASVQDDSFMGLNDMRLTVRGPWLIAAVAQLSKKRGGLHVWDARTGNLLQSVPGGPVSWIGLSFDEQQLAAVVLDQLHVYRVGVP